MLTLLDEVVQSYHRELESHQSTLPEWAMLLEREMRKRRLIFGDRILCSFLRPHFIGQSEWEMVQNASALLIGAFRKVFQRVQQNPPLMNKLGLTDAEQRLVSYCPPEEYPSHTSRLDGFLHEGALKFVEFNGECPAGIGYSDLLAEVFLEFPALKAINAKNRIKPLFCRENILNCLLAAWKKTGRKGKPRIAIVDWRDVPTRFEFEIFQEYLSNLGYPCLVIDPRELEYKNGKLRRGSYEIDVVYRRLLTNELLAGWDMTRVLVEAYRDGAVQLINPFSAKILHKKALFVLLTEDESSEWFDAAERDAIRNHIPWTRWVKDSKTTYNGKQIDLLQYIEANRDNFVLKPNDEYGGKGIFVGWDASPERWREGIEKALTFGDYLVQERVMVGRAPFPYWENGLQYGEYLVDLDPFVFESDATGFLTRLSSTNLCNVTSGGGSVPTFVVEGL